MGTQPITPPASQVSTGGKENAGWNNEGVKWTKEEIEKRFPYKGLYKVYAVNIDDGITDEAFGRLVHLMRSLNDIGWTVRVPASKERLATIEGIKMEVYKPFKNFTCQCNPAAEIKTPTLNVTKLAAAILPNYSNIPEKALTFIVNELALVVGHAMNSMCEFVVIYTPDGCNREAGITTETGYMRGTIVNAVMLNRKLFNIKNDDEYPEVMGYASNYIEEGK
jgi:hypothetical protein